MNEIFYYAALLVLSIVGLVFGATWADLTTVAIGGFICGFCSCYLWILISDHFSKP